VDGIANHFPAKMHYIAGFFIFSLKFSGVRPWTPQKRPRCLDLDTNFRLARQRCHCCCFTKYDHCQCAQSVSGVYDKSSSCSSENCICDSRAEINASATPRHVAKPVLVARLGHVAETVLVTRIGHMARPGRDSSRRFKSNQILRLAYYQQRQQRRRTAIQPCVTAVDRWQRKLTSYFRPSSSSSSRVMLHTTPSSCTELDCYQSCPLYLALLFTPPSI